MNESRPVSAAWHGCAINSPRTDRPAGLGTPRPPLSLFTLTHSLSYSCCLISSTALMPILHLSMAGLLSSSSQRTPSILARAFSSLAITGGEDGRLARGPSFPGGVQRERDAGWAEKQTSEMNWCNGEQSIAIFWRGAPNCKSKTASLANCNHTLV